MRTARPLRIRTAKPKPGWLPYPKRTPRATPWRQGRALPTGKSAGNGGSAAKDGKDKTEKATKKNETTTKKTTTTTTTVAANRKIHISVSLPAGTDTRTDKLRITINGKQVDEKKVTLEIGNTFTYTTEKKYRGDVKVQVELEHTQKSAKVTVKKGTDTAKFNFENIENLLGDDD